MTSAVDAARTARAVADELLAARRTGALIDPPSRRHPGFTMADGYRVAGLLHEERLASGAVPAGVKLGFTNQALWELLGADGPFWAPVYGDTVTNDDTVGLAGLAAPRLEPEIVVGLGRDLEPGASAADVAAAVAWAALGFEIVQCRYHDWSALPADALADAGLHGLLVVGDRQALGPGDLGRLAGAEIRLLRQGVEVARGAATEALGGPAEGVRWLLGLPGLPGLSAGSVVTTGTLTAPPPVAAGERWRSVASGPLALPALEVVFE